MKYLNGEHWPVTNCMEILDKCLEFQEDVSFRGNREFLNLFIGRFIKQIEEINAKDTVTDEERAIREFLIKMSSK